MQPFGMYWRWRVRSTKTRASRVGHALKSVGFPGADAVFCAACADGLVRIWVGDAQKHVLKGHTGPVRALAKVLPEDNDSRLFASASNDGSVERLTGCSCH